MFQHGVVRILRLCGETQKVSATAAMRKCMQIPSTTRETLSKSLQRSHSNATNDTSFKHLPPSHRTRHASNREQSYFGTL
jgi:hypothetical protein